MPTMELTRFEPTASNAEVLNAIRHEATPLYQSRIPAATRSNITDVMNAMWSFTPGRNEFVDSLVNVIAAMNARSMSYENPLGKFKQGTLGFGETIEEAFIGVLKAHEYVAEREALEEDIFGAEPAEVHTRFHKLNRRNFYKATINQSQLQRAFFNQNGLMSFVGQMIGQLNTSDNIDEFALMASLFPQYHARNGFFNLNVPDLSNADSAGPEAREFLVRMQELQSLLTFPSRAYNPAHALMVTPLDRLELFLTPRANAVINVQALAAMFNMSTGDIAARKTIIPAEYMPENTQGIVTTRDFFQVYDQKFEMQQSNNPVKLHTNYFWHRWQVISASALVPAVRLSTEENTPIIVQASAVRGIDNLTVTDEDGNEVTTVERGGVYTLTADVQEQGYQGLNNGVIYSLNGRLSQKTRVTQTGILLVGQDDAADVLFLTATAEADQSFRTQPVELTVTGPLIQGSIGQTVDEDTSTPSNTTLPRVTVPAGGPVVGAVLTTNNGSWDETADSYTYRWLANGTAISGQTADTYTIVSGNAGQTITSEVTAHFGATTKVATSKGVNVPAA